MPTLGRPDVDVLDGLTTAIIVDQERMGANARSTVGTVTDANAMLRVLWSRVGKPYIGSSNNFSFNVSGMCPRCEGMGSVNDIDLTQLFDENKSLNQGALTIPGYTADGWYVRVFGAVIDLDKPIKKFTKKERQDFLYGEQRKVKVENMNLTYEGLVPRI